MEEESKEDLFSAPKEGKGKDSEVGSVFCRHGRGEGPGTLAFNDVVSN